MKYEVWWRFWNWLLVNIVKLKFGQSQSWCLFNVLKLKSGQYIETKVLSRFWSWILVKTLRLRLSGDFGSTFWSGFLDVTKTGCIVNYNAVHWWKHSTVGTWVRFAFGSVFLKYTYCPWYSPQFVHNIIQHHLAYPVLQTQPIRHLIYLLSCPHCIWITTGWQGPE